MASAHEFRILSFEQLVSTNDTALEYARAGEPGGFWVLAKEQSGGRGRHGRHWTSPPGNLYASLLLIDPSPAERAPELGFVAGVALGSVLRELLGAGERLALKWPNDVLFDGAKLSGMLLESCYLSNGKFACVIGIGVNLASHPEGLAYPATDLAAIGCKIDTPEALLTLISRKLAHCLGVWKGPDGFLAIRQEWLKLAAGLGAEVKIMTATGPLEGRMKTIDHAGRLILASGDKEVAISAGDVFFTSDQVSA